ncbi:hypothetical protein ACFS7Z_24855 [Pontibacter toksunensis]|uniref:Uncharacterized protein n=1 Tax=Pontibacter toksunensis TaxID=1332631 RepID=A0ABW6C1N6_9BACT
MTEASVYSKSVGFDEDRQPPVLFYAPSHISGAQARPRKFSRTELADKSTIEPRVAGHNLTDSLLSDSRPPRLNF